MIATKELTDRQREVLNYIRGFQSTHGYGPSVRDIGDTLSIRSPNGVMCHLKALEKKRLIERDPNIARGIRIVSARRNNQLDQAARHLGSEINDRISAGKLTPADARRLSAELQAVVDRLDSIGREGESD